MVLPLYLAMTSAEMGTTTDYPAHLAYMACHFSPYGTGLCNLPSKLPEGTMLILNDRIPWDGHDAQYIAKQLLHVVTEKKCESVLLDFQRPNMNAIPHLITELLENLPCPIAVSNLYASDFSCPVFLPPVPLDISIRDYIAPWQGRDIWLEAALDGLTITLTATGSHFSPLPYPALDAMHTDAFLHCHYTIDSTVNKAIFTLFRTREDLSELLEEAQSLGVTHTIGLWQEFCRT